MDALASLRNAPLFAHFKEADWATLAPLLTRLQIPPGAEIVQHDESSADAYFIESGEVRIFRDTSYGRYTLATLRAGELLGEVAFIDRQPRSGDAISATAAELIVFGSGLRAALDADHRLSLALHWAFWRSLSEKLRRANQHLVGFFAEGAPPHRDAKSYDRTPTGQFEIGLAAKKRLFEEQTLTPMEINFLSSLSKEKQLPAGEVIFREGEVGDRMYVVLEGQVMISKHIPGAGEEALAFLGRGDYFGEMALIDQQPRSADAKAHTGGAVVLAIPREVVEGILDIRKVASLRLLRILCSLISKRLREIDEKILGWFMLSGGSSGVAPLT